MSAVCSFKKCLAVAYYGPERVKGQTTRIGGEPVYCKVHKPFGYIHSFMPSCEVCTENVKIAYYSHTGKKPGRWCSHHKPAEAKAIFPSYVRKIKTKA
jgi:hypothetical protein